MHRRGSGLAVVYFFTGAAWLGGCGGSGDAASGSGSGGAGATASATAEASEGEVAVPPFEVRGDCEDLMLVWFDEEGPHAASRRAEVPAERRGEVRVDSLEIDPDDRDPDHVFVADLRTADEDGNYTIRRMPRVSFDDRVDAFVAAARGEAAGSGSAAAAGAGTAGGDADVIIYGAEWCGACRQAGAFLRARGIPFIERDIENDPGAAAAMRSAARAAGVSTSGIPVIDFRGRIIAGFDRDALEEAIRETTPGGGGVTI